MGRSRAITAVGIGSNLWHPAALSFLTRRYPERKGLAIALHAMGGNLGSTVAPTAIGLALTFLVWRRVLWLNFLLGLLMGVVLWRLLAKLVFVGALAVLGFFLFSLQPVILAWMMDVAPENVGGTTVSALFGVQSLLFLAATILAANFLVYVMPSPPPADEGHAQA